MQVSRGVPLDVTSDAPDGRIATQDEFIKMPSLAVLKRSALVFIKDAKEPRDGNRQKGSTNCTAPNKLKKDSKITDTQYGETERERESERVESSGSQRRDVGEVGRVRNEGEGKNENENESTEALTLGLGLTFGSLGAFGARRARTGTGTSTSTFSASTGAGTLHCVVFFFFS
ncbi:hypothetical protein F4806DRAFT_121285 [Annulohypoxylon nitens]|nr:hypothetical protein F4806DRAFT_121285 [Annulohypoxylon nitens]